MDSHALYQAFRELLKMKMRIGRLCGIYAPIGRFCAGQSMFSARFHRARFLAATLLLLMSGCTATSVPPKDALNIKSIAIVSAVGREVSYQKIGYTVFGNEKTSGNTSDWGIDQYVGKVIAQELGGRYSISFVDVDYDELYREYGFSDAAPSLEQRFRGVVGHASPPVDAYLFLTQVTSKDFIGHSNQLLSGLAIYRRVGYGMQLYAVCDFYLVDAKDFRIIAQAPLLMDLGEPTTWQVLSGRRFQSVDRPYRAVDKSLHPANSWEALSEAQRAWIKRGFSEIFDESIPLSLKKMGLGG